MSADDTTTTDWEARIAQVIRENGQQTQTVAGQLATHLEDNPDTARQLITGEVGAMEILDQNDIDLSAVGNGQLNEVMQDLVEESVGAVSSEMQDEGVTGDDLRDEDQQEG